MFSPLPTKSKCLILLVKPIQCNFVQCFSSEKAVKTVDLAYAAYETTKNVESDTPPPLIIHHGLLGSKANWNSLSKAFHQKTLPQRKIIAVDCRNHGDSPHSFSHSYWDLTEDMRAFMESHNIPRASLLGHSMGGRVMMLFALKYVWLFLLLTILDSIMIPMVVDNFISWHMTKIASTFLGYFFN